jgi:hypothetical protein
MTSDFIDNVNFTCWIPPHSEKDIVVLSPGEIVAEPSKLLMGISDENISKFIEMFEDVNRKTAPRLFDYVTSNKDALNKGSLIFLGVKTRDLVCSPHSDSLYKFLVLPSMKIFWLNKDVVAQIVVSRKLRS